jgi:fatty acid-binding protein DegV
MPTTSQVSVITMENIFCNLVDKEFDVLGVFISANLSGTIQSAYQGPCGTRIKGWKSYNC